MPENTVSYAGYPAPFMFDAPKGKKVEQLLWGDFVRETSDEVDGWVPVRARGTDGFVRRADLRQDRLLEINFVDIGQGDGCFIVLPNDDKLLIDAGQGDNMFRFLSWRFNLRSERKPNIRFRFGLMSHSDQDHYLGFADLFGSDQLSFDTLYHNGIVERAGEELLGGRADFKGVSCLNQLVSDGANLRALLNDDALVGTKQYPKMLRKALRSERFADARMLSADDGFVPGFEEGNDSGVVLRVLGPVCEPTDDGVRRLRWFGDAGKTKNGHSVVLRLEYGKVSILLGGDLNIPAEEHLLKHHTGHPLPKNGDDDARKAFVDRARAVFRCDVSKACHHGSADYTDLYLEAVNPLATIISSGDDEPHAHPRPDALGAFGKAGRGTRPLIFSTELARSARELVKHPLQLRAELRAAADAVEAARIDGRPQAEVDQLRAKRDGLIDRL